MFSPTTERDFTAMMPPPFSPLPESLLAALLPFASRSSSNCCSSFRFASICLRCSGVSPPMYLSVYFIPSSAITAGIAVIAAFCSSPITICGAIMSLWSFSS